MRNFFGRKAKKDQTGKITHRRITVLHLKDDVLVIISKKPRHILGNSYIDETRDQLKEVYGYAMLSSEFQKLKAFQRDNVDWNPVFADWSVIFIGKDMLEEKIDHECDIESIVGHEFEEPLLERLPEATQRFVAQLKQKRAA